MSLRCGCHGALLMVVPGMVLIGAASESAFAQSPVRDLSGYTDPQTIFTVQITLNTPPGTIAAGAEETPPQNWVVSNISDSGAWDTQSQKVKWGPLLTPSIPATLTYDVTPSGLPGRRCFSGTASFDGVGQAIGGDQCVGNAVPAVSQWSLTCLGLVLAAAATVIMRHHVHGRMGRYEGVP